MADDQDDIRLTRRKVPPYWWPDLVGLMQLFLAVSIVLMVGFILNQLLTGRVTLDQIQNNLLMTLFGFILGCFKDVFGWAFGSSAGQKRQGEVITKSLEDKDKIIAGNVVAAANVAAGDKAQPATIITTAPTEPSTTPTTTTVTTEAPKP